MKVPIELQNLTNAGLDHLLQDLSGEPGNWIDDWSRVGPLIEQEQIELSYTRRNRVQEVLEASSGKSFNQEPWRATIISSASVEVETGSTTLQAIVRAFVAAFPRESELSLDVSAETVTTYLNDLAPVIDVLCSGSNVHGAIQVEGAWLLQPVEDAMLAEFQGVVRLASVLEGRGVQRIEVVASESEPLQVRQLMIRRVD